MWTVLLPPGVNPIVVNKYIDIKNGLVDVRKIARNRPRVKYSALYFYVYQIYI
jgi:hypothetical protein